MPDMDGLMLATAIRRTRPASELPLAILTSMGEPVPAAEMQRLGLAASIMKPIKPSQLFDVLAGIFSGQVVQSDAAGAAGATQFDATLGEQWPLHILLAEDHPTNQMLALRILDRLGYRADVAGNGLEVLAALERQHYDVVLMDVQMPEMDGLEATRHIRAEEAGGAHRPVHIVAMTANAMQGDREMCLAAGMNDYVSKPIRVDALVAALSRVPVPDDDRHGLHDHHEPAAPGGEADHDDALPVDPASPAGSKQAIIDRAALDALFEMTGEDFDFLAQMLESYLTTSATLLEKLKSGLATGDAGAVRMSAHTLKSGSADVGAWELSQLCGELEAMGRDDALDGAAELMARAEAIYPLVRGSAGGRAPGGARPRFQAKERRQ